MYTLCIPFCGAGLANAESRGFIKMSDAKPIRRILHCAFYGTPPPY